MYKTYYKTILPYCKWASDIFELKIYVREKCEEIRNKYSQLRLTNEQNLEKEYTRGKIYGKAYEITYSEQNCEIKKYENNDLISLERHIKSEFEKILVEIITHFNIKILRRQKGEHLLECYIRTILQYFNIDMDDFDKQKRIIIKMNKNRNKSEHESDNLLREIDSDYIDSIANATCDYADILIQRIYDENRKSK